MTTQECAHVDSPSTYGRGMVKEDRGRKMLQSKKKLQGGI
jgi:hypothetical protein